MPRNAGYYSARTGVRPGASRIALEMLQQLVRETFLDFTRRFYFDEWLGYSCVDQGHVPGTGGGDIRAYVFRRTRNPNLWPIPESNDRRLSEADIFDLVEILHDHVSKPLVGKFHDFGNCGMHWESFDRRAGQEEYRLEINPLLRDYGVGWQLSADGEVTQLPPDGMERLLVAKLPVVDERAVADRVATAKRKFLLRSASPADRRDAIRDLADVLEFLREGVKGSLTSGDEKDLFNLANNFGIRHHNQKQRTDYDEDIWFSWMFYYYLATIHAVTHLMDRKDQPTSRGASQ